MKLLKDVEFNRHCDKCNKMTVHTRKQFWPHILESLIISLWLVVWSFLSTKVLCTNCSESYKSYKHAKVIWILIPIVIILVNSVFAGFGSMDDYARNAEFLKVPFTESDLNQRGIETFFAHLIIKSVIFTFFLLTLIVRLLRKTKIEKMVWLTRSTIIVMTLSGASLIILKAL